VAGEPRPKGVGSVAGADQLEGGLGDDTLDGGPGPSDYAIYSASPAGVTVVLIAGTATGGSGNDTLSGIENVDGSIYADSLTGDNAPNRLNGTGGNDFLSGLAGNDVLFNGFAGDGGDGTDICNNINYKINCEG